MNKHIFTLLILLSSSILSTSAIDFAPVGATWYYEKGFWGDFPEPVNGYHKLESVKDTLYHGKLCRKIVLDNRLDCYGRPKVEYMYSSNDSVYFYDPMLNDFQLLYNLNAEKGDSWHLYVIGEFEGVLDSLSIRVDSTDVMLVNDMDLKRMYVTYTAFHLENGEMYPIKTYSSQIIEAIGDVFYMFNFIPYELEICDADFMLGLCNYFDEGLGVYYSGKGESCDELTEKYYVKVFDLKTESADPNAIDTTYFWINNDSLYIRNINNEFCCTSYLFAQNLKGEDGLELKVTAGGPRCLMACSFGYTLAISSDYWGRKGDTIHVTINGESFQVVYKDIVNSVHTPEESQLKMYPNPVSDWLTVDVEGIKSINVYALSGQLVSSQTGHKNALQLSSLEQGIYLVRVETLNGTYVQKIVKQ